MARLAGFEPATGCLEDMAGLYGSVSHLGFVALGVRLPLTPLVSPVGVRQPQLVLLVRALLRLAPITRPSFAAPGIRGICSSPALGCGQALVNGYRAAVAAHGKHSTPGPI
jgi:hypothetical protein